MYQNFSLDSGCEQVFHQRGSRHELCHAQSSDQHAGPFKEQAVLAAATLSRAVVR